MVYEEEVFGLFIYEKCSGCKRGRDLTQTFTNVSQERTET